MTLARFAWMPLLCLPLAAAGQQAACKLVVHLDGFRNHQGLAGVAVFKSPAGWPESNTKAFMQRAHAFEGNRTTIDLELPPGRYAIAAMHDENANHKLDRNLFGIPKEGFGFANNPRVLLSAPSFSAAAMDVRCPVTETTIHLLYK